MEELKLLQGQVDQLLRVKDTAAIEKIDVDYDQTLLKLFHGNTDAFVFANSDVDAEDMSIFVHLAPKDRNTMEVIFNCNYISVYTLLQTYRYTSKEVYSKMALGIVYKRAIPMIMSHP